MNFTIYAVTTIKIRLCPQGCGIVHEIVRRGRGRGTGYNQVDFARTLHDGVMTGVRVRQVLNPRYVHALVLYSTTRFNDHIPRPTTPSIVQELQLFQAS